MDSLRRLLAGVGLIVGAEALFAVPFYAANHLGGRVGQYAILIAVVILVTGLLALVVIGDTLAVALRRALAFPATIAARRWVALAVIIGVILRVLWVALFPAQPASDGATYLHLAERLADGQSYYTGDAYAYWPPGFPLFLAPFLAIFGTSVALITGIQLALFALTVMIVDRLAQRTFGTCAARLSVMLLALWPGYIMVSGVPTKELLIIPLLALVLLFWLGTRGPMRRAAPGFAGAALGYVALVQPAFMLFPTALFAADVAGGRRLSVALGRTALSTVVMVAVIAPWTLRNYLVLDAFVPISTNGGGGLYRANNPLATGGYTKHGAVDFSGLDEVEETKADLAAALTWISENPGRFASLALTKQMLFLGNDGTGVYWTLRHGNVEYSESTYVALKALASVFWLCLCVLTLRAFGVWLMKPGHRIPPEMALFSMPVFYLYTLHSVFESSPKYHLPLVPVIAVLAAHGALCVVRANGSRSRARPVSASPLAYTSSR